MSSGPPVPPGMCEYCGVRRAVNRDHVVPKALRRTLMANVRVSATRREWLVNLPDELLGTVPACFDCNIRKGARRLVPPSWASRIPLLNELLPGVPWRVWRGGTDEPAFRDAHLKTAREGVSNGA